MMVAPVLGQPAFLPTQARDFRVDGDWLGGSMRDQR